MQKLTFSLITLLSLAPLSLLEAKTTNADQHQYIQAAKQALVNNTATILIREIGDLLPIQNETKDELTTLLIALDILSLPQSNQSYISRLLHTKIAEILSQNYSQEECLARVYEELILMAGHEGLVDTLKQQMRTHAGSIALTNTFNEPVFYAFVTHIAGIDPVSNISFSSCLGANSGEIPAGANQPLLTGIAVNTDAHTFGTRTVLILKKGNEAPVYKIIERLAHYAITADEKGTMQLTATK